MPEVPGEKSVKLSQVNFWQLGLPTRLAAAFVAVAVIWLLLFVAWR